VQRHPIDVDQGGRPENQSKNRDMSVLPPNAGGMISFQCLVAVQIAAEYNCLYSVFLLPSRFS